jgi:2-polyprenyl-3-methyl-5-hydroxy-6-metoxy-1,4-benzoquinol methylase
MPVRAHEPELMDLPDTDLRRFQRTLRQLSWVNRFLAGSRGLVRRTILEDVRRRPGRPPYTLLDVGSGGGDLALWLARSRADFRITCLDHDPRAVQYARRLCAGQDAIEIRLGSAEDLPGMGSFDFVFAHHLLHHLEDEQVATTLDAMLACARRLLVVSDLVRSRLSYALFSLLAFGFLHGSFAVYDGRLSIRRAFRQPELEALLAGAASSGSLEIRRDRPGRVCVIGRPSGRALQPASPAGRLPGTAESPARRSGLPRRGPGSP